MSIAACVQSLFSQGAITQQQATQILNNYQRAQSAGVPNAAQASLTAAKQSAVRRKYLAALQAMAIQEITQNALSHPEGVARGVQSILGRDVTTKSSWSNVDQRREAVFKLFVGQMADAIDAMRVTGLGFTQDRALIDDVVRELFGKSTGNARAAGFAKPVADAMEGARVRFNEAGGDIPFLKGWGLPQQHDARRIEKMGKPAWKNFITPKLDNTRMLNDLGLPMTAQELDAALDNVYETITTRGMNGLIPGASGGKKLANAHQDHRFLIFKDADAWLEYDKAVGGGNPFNTILGHLETMAGDIANLEVLGPNPAHAFQVLRDTALKNGVDGFDISRIDAIWDVVGGGRPKGHLSLSTVENLAAVRNVLTSAQLGAAMLAAPSDLAFMRQAASLAKLDQVRAIKTFISLLDPSNAADRRTAARIGLGADMWTSRATAGNRYGEITGFGASARAADLTMRLSGLAGWTQTGQQAIGLEWRMTMADKRLLQWNDLEPEYRKLMEEVGFAEADWDVVRHAPLESVRTGDALDLVALYQSDPSNPAVKRAVTLANEAMETLSGLAIPSPDAPVRAINAMGGEKGTIGRELANFVLQYKSFPMAVILGHGYRAAYMGSRGSAGTYLASLALTTMAMGALSLQMKEIAKGRTPREMDSPNFWGSAFLQGGGAGLLGDFLHSGMFGVNRYGGSLLQTLAGPGSGLANDVVKLTLGQFGEVVEGEDTNIGADAAAFAGRYTPVLSSLWYARLGFERLVINQLEMLADPKVRKRWRADEKRTREEKGNKYWFRRGETAPEAREVQF
jgi:hypothetical protein